QVILYLMNFGYKDEGKSERITSNMLFKPLLTLAASIIAAAAALTTPPFSILTLNANTQPLPPSDLKYLHLVNPNNLTVDNTQYPVLRVGGLNYWGMSSFRDIIDVNGST